MSRSLDDLDTTLRWWAMEFLARTVERRIPIIIVDTLRTMEEQKANLAKGVSKTLHSKHLPNAQGRSEAIDIAPYDVYQLYGPDKLSWNVNDPIFKTLADLASECASRHGLTIIRGYDWPNHWDAGHFELKR